MTKKIKTATASKKTIKEGVLDDMDDDGFMAKRQLYDIAKYAVALHKMIQDTDNLEPWISAKITTAADYIDTVKHYLEYQGVANAGEIAHSVGMEDIADIEDSMDTTIEPQYATTEQLMADVDQEPALDGYDVLRMAHARGIISQNQYSDPDQNLLQLADSMAEMLEPGDIAGSSDVSSLMKEFVNTAKEELVLLLGPKVDAYYSMVEAKRIYEKMMSGLKGKPVSEKLSSDHKDTIRKLQKHTKAKVRPLIKLAKSSDEVTESQYTQVSYLLTDGKGSYDLFGYEQTPGSNPQHLTMEINKKAKELGWARATVQAQWKGDLDAAIADCERIAASYKDKKSEFPQQYHGNMKQAEKLRKAKEIVDQAPVEEARNPMGAINKFLATKDAKDERSAELAKDPSKTTQATKMPVQESRKRK